MVGKFWLVVFCILFSVVGFILFDMGMVLIVVDSLKFIGFLGGSICGFIIGEILVLVVIFVIGLVDVFLELVVIVFIRILGVLVVRIINFLFGGSMFEELFFLVGIFRS